MGARSRTRSSSIKTRGRSSTLSPSWSCLARPPTSLPAAARWCPTKLVDGRTKSDHDELGSMEKGKRLTARDAHVPLHRWALVAAVDDEIVALGLAGDGFVHRFHQQRVVGAGAQRCAQVG